MTYKDNEPATYSDATRWELIETANRGLHGQGAVIEAMFRLMDSINSQEKVTSRLNRWLLAFTVAIWALTLALLFLTGLQVYLQLNPR
jgi:hypothetical protein